jgi:uncharacterized membrane protein YcaP (DUF421 family)
MKPIDWEKMFVPDANPIEIFIRGSIVYLALFLLLRFVLRREAGALGLTDLLVVVLIADAAQNGMAGSYQSVPDALVLVCTLVFWSVVLAWLSFHYPFWRRVVQPPRVKLVENGELLWKNLEREKITEEELMGELRNHGVADPRRVRAAYIESDGMISVITAPGEGDASSKRKKRGA